MQIVSKLEFAKIAGISPGRVSQLLTAGKIPSNALVGEGRNAKIIVERAQEVLDRVLDPIQRAAQSAADLSPGSVDMQLKQARLEQYERQNRIEAEQEMQAQGRLMLASDVSAAMSRQAQTILTHFEGGLADMANAIAARFGISSRDVAHVLQQEFRGIRQRTADSLKAEARREAKVIEADLRDAA